MNKINTRPILLWKNYPFGKIICLDKENLKLSQENKYLNEQLEWFKRQLFGKRSERLVSDLNDQYLYLDGFENLATKEIEKKTPVPAHERKKPNRDGKDKITLPEDLPVKTIVLDIPEEQKACPETGVELVKIGVEITHKLAHTPGSYYIAPKINSFNNLAS